MKLQYLAVIFVIIIIPISFVMSQYIQTQIDTIVLQTAYDTKLNKATHDALTAFKLNSINNKYSSLSDSKIRDIEASISTFYNSLGTSMENYVTSKEDLSIFVPAIVFTLYDGYYIYSSYNNIYSTTGEGEDEKVQIQDTKNYQDGLKPYIYYSCQYKLANGRTVIVNFTLDNAITVYGDVGDGYETRSGYLINPNLVTNINNTAKTLTYNGVTIGPETLTEHLITIKDEETGATEQGDYDYIVYNNKKVYLDKSNNRYFWYDNYKKTYLESEATNVQQYINNNGVGFKSISAFEYYAEAKEFSEWVNDKLGNITQANIIKTDNTQVGEQTDYLSVNTGSNRIFNTTDRNNDPLLSSSIFNSHRMAVIRKSIETNLTTAIANYNLHANSNYAFAMPVMSEDDWDNALNNVAIISFMQGMPIGQKFYNNYSIITNTQNEEVVNDQSVYVLVKDGNNIEYHQPGCKELIEKQNNIIGSYTSLSFERQTVKISESNLQYFYPQSRNNAIMTGCYNCIVNASGDYDIDSIISGEIKDLKTGQILYDASSLYNIRKTYLTALARERYDLYKSNFD